MTELYHAEQSPLFTLTRVCLTCGKEKDLTRDFNKHAKGKYGYRAHCKECRSTQRKEELPRQEWVEVEAKICTHCDPPTKKSISEFALDSSRRDGHTGWCKECVSGIGKSEQGRERDRAYRKARRRNNPEATQVRRDTLNRWRREHPESQQELTMRRNTRKKVATTEKVSYKRILTRDGYFCYICNQDINSNAKKRSPESLTFDHVIPIQPRPGDPQGIHCEANIKPAHKVCNARKSNKPFEALTPFDRSGP